MVRRFGGSLLVLCLTAAAGCAGRSNEDDAERTPARAGEGELARRAAGCYRLELADPAGDPREFGLPAVVGLDTARLSGWPGLEGRYDRVYVAQTYTREGRPQDHPFGYWRPLDGDSLYIGHPAALAGLTVEAAVRDGELRGRITRFSDVRRPGEPGRASAALIGHPVACGSAGGP